MQEIQKFYTKFRDYPKCFEMPFYLIISSNIRKHRKIEYNKVFKNEQIVETERPPMENEANFNFMELLGESFLQDNYKEFLERPPSHRIRDKDDSIREIEANFRQLKKLTERNERLTPRLSNALYNKNYVLLSRNDSATAEDALKILIKE